jgi:hypothetical protein
LELAGMVADGRMSPGEAQFLTMTQSDEASDDSDVGLSDDSRTDDESTETELDDAADPSSSSSEDDMWNEDEMNDILNSLLATERRPLQW